MFERPATGERAVLVHVDIGTTGDPEAHVEFRLLAEAAGAQVAGCVGGFRQAPDPRLFIGPGKADELKALIEAQGAELVIFEHGLSPAQERNLERHLRCRVVDRTGLILDIFAQRARSFEGKLQVELAQLRHLSTRLVRGWTHLERQKGGIGLRGPGETQLESDRRLIGKRIAQLTKRLERIVSQRAQGRRARDRAALATVSLVGYTNAGKSTLFNRLTRSAVHEADQLFATLDPTLRRLSLPHGATLILADTVGFINRLPHALVAAFRSTLEETRTADLLLHIVDASGARRAGCILDVQEVLSEIGAGDIPQIQVFNKIDQLPDTEPRLERDAQGRVGRVWISARSGAGIDLLLAALREHFHEEHLHQWIILGPEEGALRAWFFTHAQVLSDQATDQGGWELEVMVPRIALDRLLSKDESLSERLVGERTELAVTSG
ncbi:ribosome rescue GTPase HflX [Candidatus Thiosymbion oneisti]|uniref:ribosome rescue GTPase HflX n=1 Tax=Candidatus Thiosymbion oneisti TaxID=589554 RepID=UPI000A7EBA29|nr:ribosome rescue GTPase HflX [Candidatus Thiosymbion oneisti]